LANDTPDYEQQDKIHVRVAQEDSLCYVLRALEFILKTKTVDDADGPTNPVAKNQHSDNGQLDNTGSEPWPILWDKLCLEASLAQHRFPLVAHYVWRISCLRQQRSSNNLLQILQTASRLSTH
jgi:hypothetical protein